jgi:hypothetical protein
MSSRKISDTEIEVTEVEQRLIRYSLDDLIKRREALVTERAQIVQRIQRLDTLIARARELGLLTLAEAEAARIQAAQEAEAARVAALPVDDAFQYFTTRGELEK